MEFHEKLQELRKQKGLTQEELAQILFVSRTAISKWESGRGYPNIDSLKAIAKFFGRSIDELLSGEELLTVAQEDTRQNENRIRNLVYGLLDCGSVLLMVFPFFGQETQSAIVHVPLLSLTNISAWIKVLYLVAMTAILILGILTFALERWDNCLWHRNKNRLSLLLNIFGVFLFIVSLQPYAAVLMFLFLMVKLSLLIKWP